MTSLSPSIEPDSLSAATRAGTRFVVAICTARRPAMLERCLRSVFAARLPADSDLTVIVVDNEPSVANRAAVDRAAAAAGAAVCYVAEPIKGIPKARNRALREALCHGPDWIALVDDDETVRDDWLVRLATACADHGAEVGNGPVRRRYERPPPHWWREQTVPILATGSPILEAPTNNVMFRARLVRGDGLGLAFDERLTFGNEDIDFFSRAHALGAKMIWVADAWVDEEIPASRVRPSRLLDRTRMSGASAAYTTVLRRGTMAAVARYLPRIARRIAIGTAQIAYGILVWPVARLRAERIIFLGVVRIAKAIGHGQGLLHIPHRYYEVTDGR